MAILLAPLLLDLISALQVLDQERLRLSLVLLRQEKTLALANKIRVPEIPERLLQQIVIKVPLVHLQQQLVLLAVQEEIRRQPDQIQLDLLLQLDQTLVRQDLEVIPVLDQELQLLLEVTPLVAIQVAQEVAAQLVAVQAAQEVAVLLVVAQVAQEVAAQLVAVQVAQEVVAQLVVVLLAAARQEVAVLLEVALLAAARQEAVALLVVLLLAAASLQEALDSKGLLIRKKKSGWMNYHPSTFFNCACQDQIILSTGFFLI